MADVVVTPLLCWSTSNGSIHCRLPSSKLTLAKKPIIEQEKPHQHSRGLWWQWRIKESRENVIQLPKQSRQCYPFHFSVLWSCSLANLVSVIATNSKTIFWFTWITIEFSTFVNTGHLIGRLCVSLPISQHLERSEALMSKKVLHHKNSNDGKHTKLDCSDFAAFITFWRLWPMTSSIGYIVSSSIPSSVEAEPKKPWVMGADILRCAAGGEGEGRKVNLSFQERGLRDISKPWLPVKIEWDKH